ncbi:forkhead box protein N2 [Brienomyrus brachyistius]|uniref:forkhead box protein N2 n=1 Tax=Brienomyrus brachyistius TaxID=42636 RepID=UPI0020B3C938|nr:forkhead box protein N2 [Brienomyrus brachyistius]XP_048885540.1 forkhead box protein N2 [Brienomyrus brachyistius]
MDTNSQPLPPSHSLHSALTPCLALPVSPSLQSQPLSPPSSSPLPASLPLSPLTPSNSIPLSPTSYSPSALTAESQLLSAPCHRLSPPPLSQGPVAHCPSLPTSADEDDLTCLSWLHQRGDLLPLQPLPKTIPLPQLTLRDSIPTPHLPLSSSKPPYSFSSLIFMAIEDSPEKMLPVKGIYDWIVNNFPYYRAAPGGWRNSVRHNLSLSKCFHRIRREKDQTVGKGSLWCVSPEYRPALLEVLRKTQHCHNTSSNLNSSPLLLEEGDYGAQVLSDAIQISDSLSQTLLLSSPSPPALPSDTVVHMTADQEELVSMETIELQEVNEDGEKDPLTDSGYIEFHYYQYHQYQYLVLPGETELDLETVEILQLDAEAQEAAGSLLDLAGGGH